MIVTTAALAEEKAEVHTSPRNEDFAPPPPSGAVKALTVGPSSERYSISPPAYDDLYLSLAASSSTATSGHGQFYTAAPPLIASDYPFATSSSGEEFYLPGDNPKGLMGRMKAVAPGKSSTVLLNPPPPPFRRLPPADIARDPFPILVHVGEGSTIEKGFAYTAPEATVTVFPHPFRTRDVNEQDWRLFLHDVRLAGSLSPMNKVVSGLAPLATGLGMVWPMGVYRGVQSLMRKSKVKGPVSQLIDYWNNFFFHPRGMHVSLTQGPPKYVHVPVTPKGTEDKKWRLVVSYRPAYLQTQR